MTVTWDMFLVGGEVVRFVLCLIDGDGCALLWVALCELLVECLWFEVNLVVVVY